MRLLAGFLSFVVLIAGLNPAGAAVHLDEGGPVKPSSAPSAEANTQGASLRGESYFSNCVALFKTLQTQTVEEVFLSKIENQEQMRQLLLDYNLLFNTSFYSALTLALDRRGLVGKKDGGFDFKTLPTKTQLLEIQSTISKFKNLALDVQDLKILAWEVVDEILKVSAGLGEGEKITPAKVLWLQQTQLLKAAKSSSKKELFENEMIRSVQAVLARSTLSMLKSWAALNENPGDQKRFENAGFLTMFSLGFVSIGGWTAYAMWNEQAAAMGGYESIGTVWFWFWGIIWPAIVGTLSGAVAAGSFDEGFSQLFQAIYTDVAAARGKRAAKALYTAQGLADLERHDSEQVFNLWNYMDQKDLAPKGPLSIEEACNTNFCEMTPAQVAYVGAIDLLEVKDLYEKLNAAFYSDKGIAGHLKALDENARGLLEDSESYATQVGFVKTTNAILAQLQAAQVALVLSRENIEKRVEQLAGVMKTLREQPYTKVDAELTPDQIAKGELLVARLRTDLASLETMRVNVAALNNKSDRLEEALDQLRKARAQFPKSTDFQAWKSAAQNILLIIDQVKAQKIGVAS